jgi:hypothetical protein
MKYRKKPVIIEAIKYVGGTAFDEEIPKWLRDASLDKTLYWENNNLYIKTLEGDHHVSDGDYVIRGVQGELYPCKPDIFEQTYERVTTDEDSEMPYVVGLRGILG